MTDSFSDCEEDMVELSYRRQEAVELKSDMHEFEVPEYMREIDDDAPTAEVFFHLEKTARHLRGRTE